MSKNVVQIIRRAENQAAAKQLIMFPFGGGSGYSYMELINEIDRDVEVIVINPPGHFFDEGKPLESIPAMVYLYSTNLRPLLKGEPLFFGHSIGGIVAYEVVKELRKSSQISRMVISSVNPPHCILDDVDMHSSMDTETLVEKSAKMGGMPQVFKEEPEILESFINGLRGDLKALESFVPPKPGDVEKIDVEVVILYSDHDYIVHSSKLKEWEYYLQCKEYISFRGDHFYLFEPSNRKEVGRIISESIKRI